MEFSKLKLEIYDLLGTLVPGILAIAMLVVTVIGNMGAFGFLGKISGTQLTLLLFAAFAAGQLVQEAGDRVIKDVKGPRFLKRSRDAFWASADANVVRDKIKRESGENIQSPDAAYDYCLTVVGDKFAKRDTFLAIADLARSLWLLGWAALVPVFRLSGYLGWSWARGKTLAEGLIAISVFTYLSWARMIRFRAMSDVTVFNVFLAVKSADTASTPGKDGD